MTKTPKKKCGHCKKSKSLADFSSNKSLPDGLAKECKTCASVTQKGYLTRRKHNWARIEEMGLTEAVKKIMARS